MLNKDGKKFLSFSDNDIVLLITGCIAPEKKQRWLILTDEMERLEQYISSIEWYICDSPFCRIVFCDNSNYPYDGIDRLIALAEQKNKKFEWIAFQGDTQKTVDHGKGYGEGEIIQYALLNSTLLSRARSFAKVTGRLKIANIHSVVSKIELHRNYFIRDRYRGHGIDTRFYVCDIDFYKLYLENAYKKTVITEEKVIAIEDVFYSILKRIKGYRALMDYPAFEGKSGGNGRDYSAIPAWIIKVLGVSCRINIFNHCYPFVLAIQKIWLILTDKP